MARPSRRTLLFGFGLLAGAGIGGLTRRGHRTTSLLRPPGALAEADFLAACTRCGQCVQACPSDTLLLGDLRHALASGTPYVESRLVPCNLCPGEEELLCIAACPTAALQPVADPRDIRMGVAVIDKSICLAFNGTICRTCWHACPYPYEAIVFDRQLRPVVDEAVCIGCGLCDHACPTEPSAIPIRPAGVEEVA